VSNRDKAIQAATELFHRQGFRDTSVDQILDACEISKSNFYYHFDSKESLGFAVLRKWVEGFSLHVLQGVFQDKTLTPNQKIEKSLDKLSGLIERRGGRLGCPFGNLALELSDVHEGFRTELARFFDLWADALEVCLKEGKRDGTWSEDLDAGKMARFIVAAAEGSILLAKTQRRVALLRESREMVSRLLQSYQA
jgi:TetR/AcrR family transcriptional repressor of nem operon